MTEIGHPFRDSGLLAQALTHRSAGAPHNERLEFLGDSLVNLIIADALEALVAAIYLDAGFEACRAAVLPWFEPAMAALPPPHKVGKDAKTRLQEWLQGRQKPLPVYALLSESGEEHAKTFQVSCTLTEPHVVTEGQGGSRRAAEQTAAEAALAALEALREARAG